MTEKELSGLIYMMQDYCNKSDCYQGCSFYIWPEGCIFSEIQENLTLELERIQTND